MKKIKSKQIKSHDIPKILRDVNLKSTQIRVCILEFLTQNRTPFTTQ